MMKLNFLARFARVLSLAVLVAISPLPSSALTLQRIGLLPSGNMNPGGPMVLSPDGNFYGVTTCGGPNDDGTVYSFNPQTGAIRILHTFEYIGYAGQANFGGANPKGKLLCAPDGTLYGVTIYGGAYGSGTLFQIVPDGTFSVLADLKYGEGGYEPRLCLMTPQGDIYGISQMSGYYTANSNGLGNGVIFRLDSKGVFSVVYVFCTKPPGNQPGLQSQYWPSWPTALVQTPEGTIYGSTDRSGIFDYDLPQTYGSIFRLDPDNQDIAIVASFPSQTDACYPTIWAVGNDGAFYGTGNGGVCKWTKDGQACVYHRYTSMQNEGITTDSLLFGADNCLYWSTVQGGANYCGTINKITPDGQFSVMYNFASDVELARSGIAAGNDGFLYMVAIDPAAPYIPGPSPDLAMNPSVSLAMNAQATASAAATKTKRSGVFRVQAPGMPSRDLPPVARKDVVQLNTLRRLRRSGTTSFERIIPALVNDKSAQRYPLSITSVSAPLHGTASIDPDTKRIRYQTSLPVHDTLSYTVSDGHGGTASAEIALLSSCKGVYEGALVGSGDAANLAGSLRLSVKSSKAFSGSFTLGSDNFKFSGRFNAAGRFMRIYPAKNGVAHVVELWLSPTETSWEIKSRVVANQDEFTATIPKTK